MQSFSLKQHLKNFRYVVFFYLISTFVLRCIFFVWSGMDSSISQFAKVFAIGCLFDLAALLYATIPWILLGALLPPLKSEKALQKIYSSSTFILIAVMILFFSFIAIGEITFWHEFSARFNFIAVDYLVYTNEVLKNIWESYHVVWILTPIILLSFGLTFFISRKIRYEFEPGFAMNSRVMVMAAMTLLVLADYYVFPSEISVGMGYAQQEVSKNGLHSLFAAYLHNELDYDRFYLTKNIDSAFQVVRNRMAREGTLSPESRSIVREISTTKEFKPYNIIMVSMESMSARFMKAFGSKQDLTPNLDRLATEGLFFNNVFATGTRTVRGLEALTLSIPPTPGQSILRRPRNENLYNIGDYFEDAGYQTDFLYGGYGYFDNMNAFFSANSFSVWDESKMTKEEITFKNAWGVSDENLFSKAIRRADQLTKEKKPFLQVIMTISNHRPYTYPQKIDIPSGSGREGAVKYSDYAIGEFIREAITKSWFNNTIFIFVADHDAAVSGNIAVPVADYRIPLIMYAPGLIPPQTITKLGSQIDVAPTILGLVDASYTSHFFGHDLLKSKDERAFLGTYQKVGMLRDGVLTLLGPNRSIEQFEVGPNDQEKLLLEQRKDLIDETISYYQTASVLFRRGHFVDTGDDRIKNRGPAQFQ